MVKELVPGLRLMLVFTILTGLVYPVVMTGLSELILPGRAGGSLITVKGKVVGSSRIGQPFTKPEYFYPRPSAAGSGYDATASGGTNLGPTSAKLIKATKDTIAQLEKDNPDAGGPPPMDLITSSGSGIDPDISPEAAYWEAARIAKARHISVESVRSLVASHVQGRPLGFLGEPHVNVLELNLALDGVKPD